MPTPKGKRNAGKKAHARAAGSSGTSKRKSAGKSRVQGAPGDISAKERAAFNKGHPGSPPAKPRARGAASFRFRRKYTRQLTSDLAVETVQVRATKGRKPVSNSTSAARALLKGAAQAQKKFSRKKSSDGKGTRYTARISLKWKTKRGKWVTKSLSATAENLDDAMKLLLENEQLNTNTYERWDDESQDFVQEEIGSKNKRIAQVSFDKYVKRKAKSGKHGKVSKTARSKKRK